MNNFNFSHLSRFFCCHASNFDHRELFCSSLISKYISHRQNGPQLFTSPVDPDPTFYQPRPTTSAPYYYGDIASYQQHRQQQQATHYQLTSSEPTRLYAIMDGLRVQLKNPGRSATSLRSPHVHRSDESTVSLRGWLYRLEGAALKQWKRRWCVLADYCLFYYKDVNEERMLGSLLLPSYRISPCFSSDGITRKFAFKAEHNNMKTYYFAADSKEMQQQWMNALSLASIMQLNILCPGGKPAKQKTNATMATSHNQQNQPTRYGGQQQPFFDATTGKVRAMNEDESGFLAYEAKRLEQSASSAIMYSPGANYYNANGYPGAQLNLYNSVGLPAVYSEHMSLPQYSYSAAPPKPQRAYYDPMLTYDMPAANSLEYNGAELMHPGPENYYLNNYDPFYPENGLSSLQYPEFIDASEFRDYPPNYFQRLPPRPHSADFLERNQDDDFDEECQNAFQKEDKSAFFADANNLAPKILPSRPKSSIARYEPMFSKGQHYGQQDAPVNGGSAYQQSAKPLEKKDLLARHLLDGPQNMKPYSGNNHLSKYFIYSGHNGADSSPGAKEATKDGQLEMHSLLMSKYLGQSESVASRTAPARPPLPPEYVAKFNQSQLPGELGEQSDHSPSLSSAGNAAHNKLLAKSDSTGKTETSYTSDDETNKTKLSAPRSSAQHHQTAAPDGLIEISKEEYYKASQMLFQRQKYLQTAAAANLSSSDISEASTQAATGSRKHSLRQNDWNDIGLPLPSVVNSGSSAHTLGTAKGKELGSRVKAAKMALESKIASNSSLAIDKSSSCSSSLQSFQMNFSNSGNDQEVKFKLSSKVRTYKKPKNGTAASDTSSSDIAHSVSSESKSQSISRTTFAEHEPLFRAPQPPNGASHCKRSDLSEGEEATAGKTVAVASSTSAGATATSAPYYYSDLLTEEQKAALQKKLGNFASPPPLLSRCPAINNARYLGMTSLNLKAKMGSVSGEKQLADNGHHQGNEPNCAMLQCDEREENKLNEQREKCHGELPSEREDAVAETLPSCELVNGTGCHPPSNATPSEAHIYENYEGLPRCLADSSSPESATPSNGQAPNQTRLNASLDDYFGELNDDDRPDSLHEFNLKSLRKRRVKRKSKEDLNVSDSEIHRKAEKYRKVRPFKHSRRMCFSAAEYIGKSQEELILMLLQLRRRQSELSKSCEKLRVQMESEATMMEIEPHRRDEYGYRFKELKQQLSKVEKEYEFQLPIIESIDGLIKVKSQERRSAAGQLLHNRAASTSLLDQVTLVRDKESAEVDNAEEEEEDEDQVREAEVEDSLPAVRQKLANVHLTLDAGQLVMTPESVETPNENIEHLKKQQIVLAGELDRVRGLLTHSTKKLEEKAVENAQFEQEMLIARNKLKQVLETEQEAMELTRSSKLEAELAHINQVIDDLHSRRQELNTAIENLKHSDAKSAESFRQSGTSASSFADDPLAMATDSVRSLERMKKETSRYRDLMMSSDSIPLYENIVSSRSLDEEELVASPGKMIFDQVNNNIDNSENDEFFTLNINLNKTNKQYQYGQDASSISEINNNDSQQNLNTMCEFDPTKDIHMAYGDSIVDQQIKQIYNYQAMSAAMGQKPAEIKTVREVKRESERRKYHQQQQNFKLSHMYRSDRSLQMANGNGSANGSYYMMANHYYTEGQEPLGSVVSANGDEFDVLPAYDPSLSALTSIGQGKLAHGALSADELNYTTPDIVQSTIKYDYYDGEP